MGMDGLSFSNTGIIKEQTSAELNKKIEQTIKEENSSSQQVKNIDTQKRVQEKEEHEQQNKKNNHNNQDVFEDGLVQEEVVEENFFDIENLENVNKEFYVKLNINDDIIELYDSSTDKIVDTISGNELGELVQKLNMASGIFINKKV